MAVNVNFHTFSGSKFQMQGLT